MKREDINIRDPFVLVDDGKYYLYGTRSATCWGPADGFDCYISDDLENFDGPIEIFHRPSDFFATSNFWAPECYKIDGNFYLLTTFGGENIKQGIYLLKSSSPTGPFELCSNRLTPENWCCIDGTLYFENDRPYLVFSHSFEDALDATGNADGDFCMIELSKDLTSAVSEPVTLFNAKSAPWSHPFPFAKQEFGYDGECYFSDGPSLIKIGEILYTTCSSWGENGYAVGVVVSESGSINGPWHHIETPLYPENGGHGMFFKDLDGQLIFTLHYPNDKYAERPQFYKVKNIDGNLAL